MAPSRQRSAGEDQAATSPRRARILVGTALVLATALVGAWVATAGSEERSADAFCARLTAIADLDDVLLDDAAAIAAGADDLEGAVAVAPEDIAADAEVVAEAVRSLADGAAARPTDPQAGVDEALAALQPDLERISASSQAVGRWADATCGLRLDGTPTPADPAADPQGAPATTAGAAP